MPLSHCAMFWLWVTTIVSSNSLKNVRVDSGFWWWGHQFNTCSQFSYIHTWVYGELWPLNYKKLISNDDTWLYGYTCIYRYIIDSSAHFEPQMSTQSKAILISMEHFCVCLKIYRWCKWKVSYSCIQYAQQPFIQWNLAISWHDNFMLSDV